MKGRYIRRQATPDEILAALPADGTALTVSELAKRVGCLHRELHSGITTMERDGTIVVTHPGRWSARVDHAAGYLRTQRTVARAP